MRDVQRHEVQQLIARGAQVVEVLARDEYDEEHLPGAVNIPLRHVESEGPATLDRNRPVVLYCWDSA